MNAPARNLSAATKATLQARDFRLLAEHGAFDNYARAELVEGEIWVVNAQYRRHFWARRQLVRAFDGALEGRSDGLTAADECNVALSDTDEPQPDIVLTTEPRGDGPIPLASVRLIVEISDSTLGRDLGAKATLYARHDVPEYWVMDLDGERVIRLTEPAGEAYARRDEMALAGPIEAATVDGLRVVLRL